MTRHYAATVEELLQKKSLIVTVKGLEIGLFQVKDKYFAWRNVCPHAGAPVCRGKVTGTTLPSGVYEYAYGKEQQILRCPWHGWEFDLKDGKHVIEYSKANLRGFQVEEENGNLYILIGKAN